MLLMMDRLFSSHNVPAIGASNTRIVELPSPPPARRSAESTDN